MPIENQCVAAKGFKQLARNQVFEEHFEQLA